jgi:catechol 2,3-dioxygenase-like lactoylglutathione lyase family enzyme
MFSFMGTLTLHLVTRDPDAAAAWYGSVLGAVEDSRITLPARLAAAAFGGGAG